MARFIYMLLVGCCFITTSWSQVKTPVITVTDSTTSIKNPAFTKDTITQIRGKDTLKIVPKHDPRKATFRSAVLPGWGQAYNREYWKIPIVYGAIGATAGIFFFNDKWYKRTKKAYEIKVENDSSRFSEIDPKLEPISAGSLQFYRNAYRRDRDYSVIYFLLAWGLNVVDATVFAHLKDFDVSDDLSLQLKPNINLKSTGFSLVLGPKNKSTQKLLSVPL